MIYLGLFERSRVECSVSQSESLINYQGSVAENKIWQFVVRRTAVDNDDVFERFHGNQRALCQRPPLEVIAHGRTTPIP